MRRAFGTKRGLFFKRSANAAAPTNLPLAGPFASLANTPYAGLPNPSIDGLLLYTGTNDTSEGSPSKFNNLILNGGSLLAYSPNGGDVVDFEICAAIFLWVNQLSVTAASNITVAGGTGQQGGNCGSGGIGGSGASGGGGGAGARGGCCCTGCCPTLVSGGAGGSVTDGGYGNGVNCGSGGAPGLGFTASSTYTYTYGNGANGASVFGASNPGPGTNGSGGGGSGGDVDAKLSPCNYYWGGGGGAGGGLSVVIGNTFSGAGLLINASPGLGGTGSGGFDGASGGGGVIYWAFRHKTYVGSPTIVGANSSQIFKINDNNSLTAKSWAATW